MEGVWETASVRAEHLPAPWNRLVVTVNHFTDGELEVQGG